MLRTVFEGSLIFGPTTDSGRQVPQQSGERDRCDDLKSSGFAFLQLREEVFFLFLYGLLSACSEGKEVMGHEKLDWELVHRKAIWRVLPRREVSNSWVYV